MAPFPRWITQGIRTDRCNVWCSDNIWRKQRGRSLSKAFAPPLSHAHALSVTVDPNLIVFPSRGFLVCCMVRIFLHPLCFCFICGSALLYFLIFNVMQRFFWVAQINEGYFETQWQRNSPRCIVNVQLTFVGRDWTMSIVCRVVSRSFDLLCSNWNIALERITGS